MAYQHLDLKLDLEDTEKGLMDVLGVLRPDWKKEDLTIKLLSGGFINKMYGIHRRADVDLKDGLVVRINSDCTLGLGSDRDSELRTLLALKSMGMGVAVLASFNNGLVFEFVKGQPLSDDQVRNKRIMSMVAVELARVHAKLPLSTDPRGDPLWHTRTVFNHVPETVDDPEIQSKYAANIPYDELKSEFNAIQKYLKDHNMNMVICQGDLWQGNIMYHEETDKLTLIDYEQSAFGFEAWDLAFFLVCLAGTPPDYKNHYPTDEIKKFFIDTYLREKLKVQGTGEEDYDKKFRKLYCDVHKVELLAFLHLANMCLYDIILTSEILIEDFDFIGMATDAWVDYKKRKGAYMRMTPDDIQW